MKAKPSRSKLEFVKHTGLEKDISDGQDLLRKTREAWKYTVDSRTRHTFATVNNMGRQIHFQGSGMTNIQLP